jgi:tyrosine-protein kinase Etk/Wzc
VQSRAILEPSAQLRAHIALREVQVDAIRIFATEQHPDLARLRHEIASMRRELGKLEGGGGNAKSAPASREGMENLRRFREVKFLERLSELLAQQFEAAKMDEAKDMSIIQVLDKAVEPDRRSGPWRMLIVALSFLTAALIVLAWALLREWASRASPENRQRMDLLRKLLRGGA